ncbi:hypothetical protein ACQJBY_031342 [Aegilops geniculata]
MGRLFLVHLEGNAYSCKFCRTHLGLAADIISKNFHSKHGKAYLFNRVVNVTSGINEDRMMMTGLHTVSDIFCVGCGSIVGWKYVRSCDGYFAISCALPVRPSSKLYGAPALGGCT